MTIRSGDTMETNQYNLFVTCPYDNKIVFHIKCCTCTHHKITNYKRGKLYITCKHPDGEFTAKLAVKQEAMANG